MDWATLMVMLVPSSKCQQGKNPVSVVALGVQVLLKQAIDLFSVKNGVRKSLGIIKGLGD